MRADLGLRERCGEQPHVVDAARQPDADAQVVRALQLGAIGAIDRVAVDVEA